MGRGARAYAAWAALGVVGLLFVAAGVAVAVGLGGAFGARGASGAAGSAGATRASEASEASGAGGASGAGFGAGDGVGGAPGSSAGPATPAPEVAETLPGWSGNPTGAVMTLDELNRAVWQYLDAARGGEPLTIQDLSGHQSMNFSSDQQSYLMTYPAEGGYYLGARAGADGVVAELSVRLPGDGGTIPAESWDGAGAAAAPAEPWDGAEAGDDGAPPPLSA
jgi:hypothetical protein